MGLDPPGAGSRGSGDTDPGNGGFPATDATSEDPWARLERGVRFAWSGGFEDAAREISSVYVGDSCLDCECALPGGECRADRVHGFQQIRAMIRDRPTMALEVDEDCRLVDWVARRFGGCGTEGWLVFWNPDPTERFNAQSLYPTASRVGFVQISATRVADPDRGRSRTFEEMWSSLVFELFNVANHEGFAANRTRAFLGACAIEDYVEENLRLEHLAMLRSAAFYAREVLGTRGRCLGLDSSLASRWKVGVPLSFEEYLAVRSPGVHSEVYGSYYRELNQQGRAFLVAAMLGVAASL